MTNRKGNTSVILLLIGVVIGILIVNQICYFSYSLVKMTTEALNSINNTNTQMWLPFILFPTHVLIICLMILVFILFIKN